jgi:hypothetical protein
LAGNYRKVRSTFFFGAGLLDACQKIRGEHVGALGEIICSNQI